MEEDIKFMIRDLKAMGYNLHFINQLENLLKAYKEDKEKISSLCYELGKYMAKSEEDEAVIEEMAEMLVKVPNSVSDDTMTAVVKASINRNLELHKMKVIEYVRNKVKEK